MPDLNPNWAAEESLIRAHYNDFSMIARRIRERTADDRELDFVAKILEAGKFKKRRKGTGSYETFKHHLEVYEFIVDRMRLGDQETYAFVAAAKDKKLQVSERMAREIYKQACKAISEYKPPFGNVLSPFEALIPIARLTEEAIRKGKEIQREIDNEYAEEIERRMEEYQCEITKAEKS
jgi:hypothetical protein